MSKRELRARENFARLCAAEFPLMAVGHPAMKQIKLSGREQAVLRAIDYATGNTGEELRERTQLDAGDLADVLNGLCEVGYVETFPPIEPVTFLNYEATRFEINPSYAQQLKETLRRD